MHRLLLIGLIFGFLGGPSIAAAQTRDRIKITNVRIGLPGGQGSGAGRQGLFKSGQWAPVYADLECVRDTEEQIRLTAEVSDPDLIISAGSVDLAAMTKGERRTGTELGKTPFIQAPRGYASVTIRVSGVESDRTFALSTSRSEDSIHTGSHLILSIGGTLSSLRLNDGDNAQGDLSGSRGELRKGWVNAAQLTETASLPDLWIGYSAVDLMILNTGSNRAFWEELAAPLHEKRRRAIVEWVRRGGRLVVGLGTNVDAFANIREFRDLLPANLPPASKINVNKLEMTWQMVVPKPNVQLRYDNGQGEFASAVLEPREDRVAKALLRDFVAEGARSGRPLAVQGSFGLGRVSVFAFDLDRSPFVDFPERAAFWESVIIQCGMQIPNAGVEMASNSNTHDELSSELQGNLDFFEGVPVVSFGWVALFILLYIVLIGPVDYFFLKKVVRRLEWTWVTFPLIVVAVSAAAYFTAYAIKGNELKTNKIDVVDYDLITGRVDGHSWFTLFSPRIEKYTLGVEPAAGEAGSLDAAWTHGKSPESAFPSILGWYGSAGRSAGGGGMSLFSKRYEYQSVVDPADPNRDLYAHSLSRVPIQVWTTKSFSARWVAPLDEKQPPVVANLSVSRGSENALTGTITNMLPVEQFSDIALVWRGRVFQLLDLPRGVAKPVTITTGAGEGDASTTKDFKAWLKDDDARYAGAAPYVPKNNPSARGFDAGSTSNPNFRLWKLLFHEAANDLDIRNGKPMNSSMRELDQSWRVGAGHSEQAMLILRAPTVSGPAEEITLSPNSPSRLWIGASPTDQKQRPANPGTLRQETYIRVIIPVKTAR